MQMSTEKQRVRRSEKMTSSERNMFSRKVDSFDTKVDAAEYFGFSRVTLDNILLRGSGKAKTIELIREKLKQSA